jgi:glucosamine--fructose-6-phosphate aminotransferase (isomerizing)
MCGIIGFVGTRHAVPVILDGLRRLEYRGYDSAGLAVVGSSGLQLLRATGKLINLEERAYANPLHGSVGIGHTRWATHGAPTEANAHPQTDASGAIAVVHNGILENYSALRRRLTEEGVQLSSDTDTELIAQLLGRASGSLLERVQAVLPELRGQYAVVAVSRSEPDTVVAFRNGPPLVVGLGEEECLVASDVTALIQRTRRISVLDNGHIAVVSRSGMSLIDAGGRRIEPTVEEVEWDATQAEKGGYRHFMLKEIHEQPEAARNTILAHVNADRTGPALHDLGFVPERLCTVRRVHLVACGTSWHACLVGKFYIETVARVATEVDYASEYRYRSPLIDADTLVIGVSQSGETADTLAALELARSAGAMVATVCNVRGSSCWRLADAAMLTQAGPEIGVASTKAFTTQLVSLLLLAATLAEALGRTEGAGEHAVQQLLRLPAALEATLQRTDHACQRATEMVTRGDDSLFLGRGLLYPIALEGALKLKEISYLHAEGYPAGEMKHGPIALVSEQFPVIGVAPATASRDKVLGNLMEVRARGATVLAVAEESSRDVVEVADLVLPVPAAHELLQPIVCVLPLQLLAYHTAVELGKDVDQPRNLAKSVTVE